MYSIEALKIFAEGMTWTRVISRCLHCWQYTFVSRQGSSPHDAEDIVQEALIRAYYALGDYPEERVRALKLQPWLYKIT